MNSYKKPPLGRNLSSMLSQSTLKEVQSGSHDELRNLALEVITPGRYQPRSVFDEEKLRWRAAQMAAIDEIPAVIRDVPDEVSVAMALIENIQREDLNPLEEATALRRLIDDFQMTQQEAADAVGRSRPAVSNLLRLLELMQEVKDMIDMRRIEMGHARALLSLDDKLQVQAAREVVRKRLSVRQTENLVRRLQQSLKKKGTRRIDPDILRLQTRVGEQLGAQVRIQHQASGKGKLIISYNTADEFEGILERLDLSD